MLRMLLLSLIFLVTVLPSACISKEPSIKKSLTVIWQVPKESYYETDWIKELLSKLTYREYQDTHYQYVQNRALIITSAYQSHSQEYKEYIKKLTHLGYRFGLIYLNDEYYGGSVRSYQPAKFILRNYWHKKFKNQPKVVTLPLGYKTGFWQNMTHPSKAAKKKAVERRYTWSFAGQLVDKPTRQQMVAQLDIFKPFFIHEIFKWSDPNSLPVTRYRDLLLDSIFIPCPRGWWNVDSYRLCEALECGCIPIVEKISCDYFRNMYGPHPFLEVSTWDDAPAVMQNLLLHPKQLEKKRLECYHWWQKYKKKLQSKITKTINKKLLA